MLSIQHFINYSSPSVKLPSREKLASKVSLTNHAQKCGESESKTNKTETESKQKTKILFLTLILGRSKFLLKLVFSSEAEKQQLNILKIY